MSETNKNENKTKINRIEKSRNVKWNKIWIGMTIFFTSLYLLWRFFFTIPHEKGTLSIVFWLILLLVEVLGLLEMMVHFYNMYDYDVKEVKQRDLSIKDYPEVDVLVPTLNEPVELLRETLTACRDMNYPKQELINVYVCDDGEREEVRALADELGINYLGRTDHLNAKAGNLNFALENSKAPYVAVFDADMIPYSDFLMETIPYFTGNIIKDKTRNKKSFVAGKRNENRMKTGDGYVGFVQTPQSFYEPDVFQRNLYCEESIPNEQDYFYRVVQISKNKSNSVIFGGSNAVLYREALSDIGGIVTGVLTEDFATGIEIEKRGYKGIAIDTVLASGKTPQSFGDLIKQRRRWARGCIQSGRKTGYLLTPDLSFAQKLNYFIGISYWYSSVKRVVYFLAPVLFALFNIVVVECRIEQVFMFWLPMYVCCNISMHRFSKGIRTTKWTDIYETALCPFMMLPVLMESIGIKKTGFDVTGKQTKNAKTSNIIYMLPFVFAEIIAVMSFMALLSKSSEEGTFIYVAVMFWLIMNIYFIWMSILVTWGRKVETTFEGKLATELNGDGNRATGIKALFKHLTE